MHSTATQPAAHEVDWLRRVAYEAPMGIGVFRALPQGDDLSLVYANRALEQMCVAKCCRGDRCSEMWPHLPSFAVARMIEVSRSRKAWSEHDVPVRIETDDGPRIEHYSYHISAAEIAGEVLVFVFVSQVVPNGQPADPDSEQTRLAHKMQDLLEGQAELTNEARASEERYRALFEQAAVGIAIVAPDGRWLEVNHRLAEIAGYDHDELLGVTFREITYPEDLDADLEQMQRVAAGEIDSYSMQKRYVRKDGSIKWILLTVGCVRDEEGRPQFYPTVVQDIDEQKRSEGQLKEQLRTTRSLLDAANAIAQWPDLERVLDALAHTVVQSSGHTRASLLLWDYVKREATLLASAGTDPIEVGTVFPLASLSAHGATATQAPDAVFTIDYDLMPEGQRGLASTHDAHLGLIVPIRRRDTAIGAIYVDDPGERRSFTGPQTEVVVGIARQASVAIENARLYDEQQRRRRRIEALHGVMEVVVATLDLHSASQSMLDYLAAEHGFEIAGIWIARGDSLEICGAVGYPHDEVKRFSPMDPAAPYDAAKVFRTGKPVVARDREHANPSTLEAYDQMGIELGSYAVLPLTSRGHTIGAAHFGWHRPEAVNEFDLQFYESICAEVSVVLENIELYEQRTVQAEYAQAVNRIGSAIHSTLEFDEIMNRVVVEVADALHVDAAAIHLRESGGWDVRHSYGVPGDILGTRIPDEQAGLSMRILKNREPVIINDLAVEGGIDVEGVRQMGATALAGVPLIVRGQVLGVLYAGRFGGPARFGPPDVDFMTQAAAELALALENARLYEIEHDIADRLQGALLAVPDMVPGIEFAHAYHSATDTARVGGDFYDVFQLDINHVAFVIGDVAGKGLEAAVLTSMVKNTIRAHASERGKTVAHTLKLTNDVVYKSTTTEAFVTVFLGVLDCRDGRLCFANAGHTTGVLVGSGGAVRRLEATGPLIGAFPDVEYGMAEIKFDGDTLFLYTDGLTEARREREFYGEERLLEFLSGARATSAHGLVQAAVDEVMEFTGDRLSDDLALLAVRRVAEGDTQTSQQEIEV